MTGRFRYSLALGCVPLFASGAAAQVQRLIATPVATLEGKNVVAAALGQGTVVVPVAIPGRLSAFDTAGRLRWSRAVGPRLIGGVVVSGDTIASLESDEGWQLALYRLQDGREIRRISIDIAQGSEPLIIGGNSGRWLIAVSRRFTPPPLEPLPHPLRSFLAVDGQSKVDTLFVIPDSGLQVTPPRAFGRSPIRAPFAPITSSTANSAGDIVISTGWELIGPKGSGLLDTVRLTDIDAMSGADRDRQIEAWLIERARSLPPAARPDTLLRRLAVLDTTTGRLGLGKIVISPAGELLVARRDLAKLHTGSDSLRVDLMPAGSQDAVHTVRLGRYDTVLAYDGEYIVVSRNEPAGPPESSAGSLLIVWRVGR